MRLDEKPLETLFGVRLGSPIAYALATALAAGAVTLRIHLDGYAPDAQFIAYFPAVLIAAYLCGMGPGILTALLCGLGSWYLILPPAGSWLLAERAHGYELAMYFTLSPLGAVAIGALCSAITRRRRAEAQQQLLIGELQHRTRNLLAIVRGISDRMLRSSGSLEEFGSRFGARLAALGRAQSLMAGEESILDFETLVKNELTAHKPQPCGCHVRLSGPMIALPSPAAMTVALAVHELAANAASHGALAHDGGQLEVSWELVDGGRLPAVAIDWRESGVRLAAAANGRSGFGRQLIEKALPYDLGAETRFEIMADGVRCRIELPLDAR